MEEENSDRIHCTIIRFFYGGYLLLHAKEHIKLGATKMAGSLPSPPLPDIQLLPIVFIGMWNYFDWLNYLMRSTNCLPRYYDERANMIIGAPDVHMPLTLIAVFFFNCP
uniref:Uncharacterized protein n=1 Tax=Glossina austeni TaxID=7395 RepID=A0A1A9VUE4_GLOAU